MQRCKFDKVQIGPKCIFDKLQNVQLHKLCNCTILTKAQIVLNHSALKCKFCNSTYSVKTKIVLKHKLSENISCAVLLIELSCK
jgi:hypothetical protein